MLRIGYLDEAVPAELLDARVEALARIIASNAPIAVRGMKRAQRDRAQQSQPTAATASASPRQSAGRQRSLCRVVTAA